MYSRGNAEDLQLTEDIEREDQIKQEKRYNEKRAEAKITNPV